MGGQYMEGGLYQQVLCATKPFPPRAGADALHRPEPTAAPRCTGGSGSRPPESASGSRGNPWWSARPPLRRLEPVDRAHQQEHGEGDDHEGDDAVDEEPVVDGDRARRPAPRRGSHTAARPCVPSLSSRNRSEKSTLPRARPIGGMMTSSTSDFTMVPKAPPMMMPTARSTTLPRIANSLNSLSIAACLRSWDGTELPPDISGECPAARRPRLKVRRAPIRRPASLLSPSGSRRQARAPRRPFRGSRRQRSAVRLGDLPAQHQPDAGAARLGGEERHEEVARDRARPGPSSSTMTSSTPAAVLQPTSTPPSGLQRGIGRVAHQVDQQLIELVAVSGDPIPRGPPSTRTSSRVSSAATRRTQVADVHRAELRLREPGEPRVGAHEPAQRLRAALDHFEARAQVVLPVGRARRPGGQTAEASRDGLDRRERVVDLVSQHPDQPLPRRALFGAEHPAQVGDDQQLMGQAVLPEGPAAHFPASRATGKGRLERAGALAAEPVAEAERVGRPARSAAPRAGPAAARPPRFTSRSRRSPSKAKTATSISSITRRSSAVASSSRSRWPRSVSLSAFTSSSARPSASSAPAPRARME